MTAYWSYWAAKGDAKAIALMNALAVEALERRADAAFSVTKAEQEYDIMPISPRYGKTIYHIIVLW